MAKELQRQGGRSARIQAAVHRAVRELGAGATVPAIAEHAGVTPSTIYRRWGDLTELLADVATERLRPVAPPADTGTARGDLEAYALQLAEEMGSPAGRHILRDIVTTGCGPQCHEFSMEQLGIIADRAHARGETFVPEDALDLVVAPILMRVLHEQAADEDFVRRLIVRL